MFETEDHLSQIFNDLCKNASVEILESILSDMEDWGSPVAQKVRGIVKGHLQQKLENEKDHLRDTLAGTETIN